MPMVVMVVLMMAVQVLDILNNMEKRVMPHLWDFLLLSNHHLVKQTLDLVLLIISILKVEVMVVKEDQVVLKDMVVHMVVLVVLLVKVLQTLLIYLIPTHFSYQTLLQLQILHHLITPVDGNG